MDLTKRRRIQRLQQVREQSRNIARNVREEFKKQQQTQALIKLNVQSGANLAAERTRTSTLKNQYAGCVAQIGSGYRWASEQLAVQRSHQQKLQVFTRKAEVRGKVALRKVHEDYHEQRIEAQRIRQHFDNLSAKHRIHAACVSSQDLPPLDPMDRLTLRERNDSNSDDDEIPFDSSWVTTRNRPRKMKKKVPLSTKRFPDIDEMSARTGYTNNSDTDSAKENKRKVNTNQNCRTKTKKKVSYNVRRASVNSKCMKPRRSHLAAKTVASEFSDEDHFEDCLVSEDTNDVDSASVKIPSEKAFLVKKENLFQSQPGTVTTPCKSAHRSDSAKRDSPAVANVRPPGCSTPSFGPKVSAALANIYGYNLSPCASSPSRNEFDRCSVTSQDSNCSIETSEKVYSPLPDVSSLMEKFLARRSPCRYDHDSYQPSSNRAFVRKKYFPDPYSPTSPIPAKDVAGADGDSYYTLLEQLQVSNEKLAKNQQEIQLIEQKEREFRQQLLTLRMNSVKGPPVTFGRGMNVTPHELSTILESDSACSRLWSIREETVKPTVGGERTGTDANHHAGKKIFFKELWDSPSSRSNTHTPEGPQTFSSPKSRLIASPRLRTSSPKRSPLTWNLPNTNKESPHLNMSVSESLRSFELHELSVISEGVLD